MSENILSLIEERLSSAFVFPTPEVKHQILTGIVNGGSVILRGPSGTGKTYISRIIQELFGGGAEITASLNEDPKDVFSSVEVRDGKVATVWTESYFNKAVTIMDEISRIPAELQLRMFRLFENRVDVMGESRSLGKDGYSLVIGGTNEANSYYPGVFSIDEALKERIAIVIDIPPIKDTDLFKMELCKNSVTPLSPSEWKAFLTYREKSHTKSLSVSAMVALLALSGLNTCVHANADGNKRNIRIPYACEGCQFANTFCPHAIGPLPRRWKYLQQVARVSAHVRGAKAASHMDVLLFGSFDVSDNWIEKHGGSKHSAILSVFNILKSGIQDFVAGVDGKKKIQVSSLPWHKSIVFMLTTVINLFEGKNYGEFIEWLEFENRLLKESSDA